jgi:multiple sugar transport system permease protein
VTAVSTASSSASVRIPGRRRSGARVIRPGHLFVLAYVVLLVAFGIGPTIYSLYLAFTKTTGGFAGFSNFSRTASDFRFLPAVGHVASYLAIWLAMLAVLVVLLALVVHRVSSGRTRTFIRFVYYIPGALVGAASVVLWLFVLDPAVSPIAAILRLLGNHTFADTISSGHLPFIFAVIAFWTGAGGWILVLYGALNTIPEEVMEAAKIDGSGPIQTALRIQLPMIRKWIVYMLILSLAAGTQLFVEPTLISQASFGVVPNTYSLNQLAYQYAFTQNDFNGSAAIAIDLLVFSLICAAVFVARGRLFETD